MATVSEILHGPYEFEECHLITQTKNGAVMRVRKKGDDTFQCLKLIITRNDTDREFVENEVHLHRKLLHVDGVLNLVDHWSSVFDWEKIMYFTNEIKINMEQAYRLSKTMGKTAYKRISNAYGEKEREMESSYWNNFNSSLDNDSDNQTDLGFEFGEFNFDSEEENSGMYHRSWSLTGASEIQSLNETLGQSGLPVFQSIRTQTARMNQAGVSSSLYNMYLNDDLRPQVQMLLQLNTAGVVLLFHGQKRLSINAYLVCVKDLSSGMCEITKVNNEPLPGEINFSEFLFVRRFRHLKTAGELKKAILEDKKFAMDNLIKQTQKTLFTTKRLAERMSSWDDSDDEMTNTCQAPWDTCWSISSCSEEMICNFNWSNSKEKVHERVLKKPKIAAQSDDFKCAEECNQLMSYTQTPVEDQEERSLDVFFMLSELASFDFRNWLDARSRASSHFDEKCLRLIFFREILKVIQLIHDAGLVHCDLKPENLVICRKFKHLTSFAQICAIDLELAGYKGSHVNTSSGSQLYAAPEQTSAHVLDFSLDAYALGIVLYEIFADFELCTERVTRIIQLKQNGRVPDNFSRKEPLIANLVVKLCKLSRDERLSVKEAISHTQHIIDTLRNENIESSIRANMDNENEFHGVIKLPNSRSDGVILGSAIAKEGQMLESVFVENTIDNVKNQ